MKEKIFVFLKKHKYLLIIIGLNALLFSTCILPVIIKTGMLPTDTYRDIAYAQHVLNGNPLWEDPTIKGEYIWYPPLNPLLFALLSKITTIDLYTLYAYSPLYICFFIPILFYFFLARLFDKKTGFLSVLLIPIMPWIITHIYTRPIPSWHTFVVILLIMNYFIKSHKTGFNYRNSIILGLAIGISFNHHSLSTLLTYGAIFLFMLTHHFIFGKKYHWQHLLLVLLLPLLCWSPYLLLNLFRTKLNLEPLHFMADEIYDPQFALFIPNQYLFILTILVLAAGFIFSLQKFKTDSTVLFLYCLLAITIGGQLLGFIHVLSVKFPAAFGCLKNVPFLIPHEFQWFFQFFSLPLVAYGFIRIFEVLKLVDKKSIFAVMILALFLLQSYIMAPENATKVYDRMVWNRKVEPELTKWISKNTPVDAVILTSNTIWSFFFIQPYTGRWVVAQFDGHTNFNVDNQKRTTDMYTMLTGADLNTFMQLAGEYEVDYAAIIQTDISQERLDFFNSNFQVLFRDPNFPFGSAVLYKIDR